MAKANKPNQAARVDALEDQFVREYFACGLNATRAYLRVYPKSTFDSARSSAAAVLARPSVKAKVSAHKRRLAKVAPVTGVDVIREMMKIAFADIGDVIDFRAHPPALRPGTAIDPAAETQRLNQNAASGKKPGDGPIPVISKGGSGLLIGGVPGVAPARVVIIGGGVVGVNATEIAVGMGAV